MWVRVTISTCHFRYAFKKKKSRDTAKFQDMNNFESDPEEFAKTFCKDLDIEDPEVAVSSGYSVALVSK